MGVVVLSSILERNLDVNDREGLIQELVEEGYGRERVTATIARTLIPKGLVESQNGSISATESGVQYMSNLASKIEGTLTKAKEVRAKFSPAQYKILSFLEGEANNEGWVCKSGEETLISRIAKELIMETDTARRRIWSMNDEGTLDTVIETIGATPEIVRARLTDTGEQKLAKFRSKYPEKIDELELKMVTGFVEEGEVDPEKIKGKGLDRHFESMQQEITHLSRLLGKEPADFSSVFFELCEEDRDKQIVIGDMSWEIRLLEAEVEGVSVDQYLDTLARLH